MGVNDRDYMKGKEGESDILDVNLLVKRLVKTGVFLVVLLLCLRIPPLWIKIPMSLAVLFFGIRWILKPPTRKVKRKKVVPKRRPIRKVSPSREVREVQEGDIVKRLIALDASGQFGQAKSLIQSLDGREFPESEAKELAVIAGNYFPVQLEPSEKGVRFMLV